MKVLGGYGESGVVLTDDEKIYQHLKRLRHAGTTSDPKNIITNECLDISLNHKMDTINAALLLVALKYLPDKQKTQNRIAFRYDQELPKQVIRQRYQQDEVHGRYVYPIIVDERDQLKAVLETKHIETKIMHEPLASEAPVYSYLDANPTPLAKKILSKSLIIPSHNKLSEHQLDYVINTMHDFFK